MSTSTEDVKPSLKIDTTHEMFNINVEEEELDISATMGQSKVWAMKVPKFLLERWERVQEGGVNLGTLVVDNSSVPPRITLKLPVEVEEDAEAGPSKRPKLDVHGIPDEYEIVMPSERVRNTYVFTEKQRTWVSQGGGESSANKRKREKARPKLLASLDHEGSVRPIQSEKYLKILQQRRLESEQSKRPIVQLDDTKMSQAKLNQLASGFSNATSTLGKNMVSAPGRLAPGERFARLERHELTDRLFALFSDKPYWSITALKATLQQPDAWLREVLKDVAVLIREGQYANMWELRENWKETAPGDRKPLLGDDGKIEIDEFDEDDDDDDDDDELEQVVI